MKKLLIILAVAVVAVACRNDAETFCYECFNLDGASILNFCDISDVSDAFRQAQEWSKIQQNAIANDLTGQDSIFAVRFVTISHCARYVPL